jgi:hypothetical protein
LAFSQGLLEINERPLADSDQTLPRTVEISDQGDDDCDEQWQHHVGKTVPLAAGARAIPARKTTRAGHDQEKQPDGAGHVRAQRMQASGIEINRFVERIDKCRGDRRRRLLAGGDGLNP